MSHANGRLPATLAETNAHECRLPTFIIDRPDVWIQVRPCGPLDAPALTDWADANLHDDYFFRRGHWTALLVDPDCQVWAIAITPSNTPTWGAMIGIAITRSHTTLLNLYLDKTARHQGIGAAVLEALAPETIRCKTDAAAGDPTDFYTRNGYEVLQTGEGKHGKISVLRRRPGQPNFPP